MSYPAAFLELQARFACRLAELTGQPSGHLLRRSFYHLLTSSSEHMLRIQVTFLHVCFPLL